MCRHVCYHSTLVAHCPGELCRDRRTQPGWWIHVRSQCSLRGEACVTRTGVQQSVVTGVLRSIIQVLNRF